MVYLEINGFEENRDLIQNYYQKFSVFGHREFIFLDKSVLLKVLFDASLQFDPPALLILKNYDLINDLNWWDCLFRRRW